MLFKFKKEIPPYYYYNLSYKSKLKGELYIGKIPENVNEIDIKNYFTKFGAVLSVKIYERKYRRRKKLNIFRYGFVNFKNSQAAVEALLYKPHYLGDNKSFTLKPTNEWEQMKLQKRNDENRKRLQRENFIKNRSEGNSILELNDKCLIHIFSFLLLKEQINLSMLCERFRKIFIMGFQEKKQLTLSGKEVTLIEIEHLLIQLSDKIENLHLLDLGTKQFEEIFMKYSYKSLRSLDLDASSFGQNYYNFIFDFIGVFTKRINCLEKLILTNTNTPGFVNKISFLENLSALNCLHICTGTYFFEPKDLHKLKQLKQLNFGQCFLISPQYFSQIYNFKNLQYLNIWGCKNLTRTSFEKIATNLTELKSLVISCNYATSDLHHIAELKKLTQLVIYDAKVTSTDYLFTELARLKANSLEELVLSVKLNEIKKKCILQMRGLRKLSILFSSKIDDKFVHEMKNLPNLTNLNLSGCAFITANGIASLFRGTNNKLQSIDISFCRQNLAEVIYSTIEEMKKFKRLLPCTFYIEYNNQYEYLLKDPKYLESTSLLSITFQKIELTDDMESNLHELLKEY